jgi:hypothetical protein
MMRKYPELEYPNHDLSGHLHESTGASTENAQEMLVFCFIHDKYERYWIPNDFEWSGRGEEQD